MWLILWRGKELSLGRLVTWDTVALQRQGFSTVRNVFLLHNQQINYFKNLKLKLHYFGVQISSLKRKFLIIWRNFFLLPNQRWGRLIILKKIWNYNETIILEHKSLKNFLILRNWIVREEYLIVIRAWCTAALMSCSGTETERHLKAIYLIYIYINFAEKCVHLPDFEIKEVTRHKFLPTIALLRAPKML